MGWETLAIAGFAGLNAVNTMNAGTAQAQALAEEGGRQTKTIADNTIRTTGKLTTSFLQSGLTLEGGPMDVLTQAFAQGRTDISRTADNYNNQAKNAVSAARTKALSSLTSSFASAGSGLFSGGGLDSAFTSAGSYLPDNFAYGLNDAGFGTSAYDMLAKSDLRG